MESLSPYLIFTLDGQQYALPLSVVDRVTRAVELTTIPDGPENLIGLINIRGMIIPVLDLRRRLHLPLRDMELNDRIIISRASAQSIALVVDTVQGVIEFEGEQVLEAQKMLPEMEHYVEGVEKLDENTVLIYDINRLFCMKEMKGLERAMANP